MAALDVACENLVILDIETTGETAGGLGDGRMDLIIEDKNPTAATYKVEFEYVYSGFKFYKQGLVPNGNKLSFGKVNPGTFTNIKVTRELDNCRSEAFEESVFVEYGIPNLSKYHEVLSQNNLKAAPCASVSFTNCEGNSQTITNVQSNTITNLNGEIQECFVFIDDNCNSAGVVEGICIDGSLSPASQHTRFSHFSD